MAGENDGGLPGAGWFPDPAGAPAYRWWDGAAWTTAVHPYAAAPQAQVPDHDEVRGRGNTFVRVVLIVAAVLFFGVGGVVVLLFPALVINDADNGRLGHDLAFTWLPFVLICGGAGTMCVVSAVYRHGRETWSALWWPVLGVAAIVLWDVILRNTSLGIH